jgi:hypothetical protein
MYQIIMKSVVGEIVVLEIPLETANCLPALQTPLDILQILQKSDCREGVSYYIQTTPDSVTATTATKQEWLYANRIPHERMDEIKEGDVLISQIVVNANLTAKIEEDAKVAAKKNRCKLLNLRLKAVAEGAPVALHPPLNADTLLETFAAVLVGMALMFRFHTTHNGAVLCGDWICRVTEVIDANNIRVSFVSPTPNGGYKIEPAIVELATAADETLWALQKTWENAPTVAWIPAEDEPQFALLNKVLPAPVSVAPVVNA